jgi:hypothetical protein
MRFFVVLGLAARLSGEPGMALEAVQGDGAIHVVEGKSFVEPVVRVVANGQPVSGAVVTFLLPKVGPGGSFRNETMLTVTTDAEGVAIGHGFRPNTLPGQYELRVTASSEGRTARMAMLQTNAAPSRDGRAVKLKSRSYVILGLIAGGAAAGAAVALGGGNGGVRATTPGPLIPPAAVTASPSVTITAGAGSMGAPGQ